MQTLFYIYHIAATFGMIGLGSLCLYTLYVEYFRKDNKNKKEN